MELTAVPTMESANVPQDGLAFTVHNVSILSVHSLIGLKISGRISFSTFTLYSSVYAPAAEPF